MLDELQTLALRYARMQRKAALYADAASLRMHISNTLRRCLPASIITNDMVDNCLHTVHVLPCADDPMHTAAIHAFAGHYLLTANETNNPLLTKLHHSAQRLLQKDRPASRDDLRLVTLDALYEPKLLPSGEATAFVRHRLGLRDGIPRSCEEISCLMHKPLVYIHELEAAVLTTLSSHFTGGHHA